jgi:hypothetical protein
MHYIASIFAIAFAGVAVAEQGVSPNNANGLKITKRSEYCGTDSKSFSQRLYKTSGVRLY